MLKLIILLPLLVPGVSEDPQSIFRDLSLAEAVEVAAAEKKLVLLDAMTSWCAPCRQMELTTWRDPQLVPWLKGRAVCIKLDMDKHTDIRQRLGIRGYPTLVAFRDGVAFDQITGFKTAAQVQSWIEELQHGTADLRRLLQRVESFKDMRVEDVNFEDRRAVAESLLDYGQDEVAGVELLWLWNNIPKHAPLLAAWRWDVLPGEISPLVERVEFLRAAISTKRLALRPLTNRLPTITHLRDWIELNAMLEDDSATAIFCGAALEVKSGRTLIRKLDHRLFPLLIKQGDWRAAGLVLEDPVQDARKSVGSLKSLNAQVAASERESRARSLDDPSTGDGQQKYPLLKSGGKGEAAERGDRVHRALKEEVRTYVSLRYAALISCDRGLEASRVAEVLLSGLDEDASRIALVTQAIAAGVAHKHKERHVRWLDETMK
jgi:thiol-disulfide isomerase/thioredoxin